jgi:hypothetical protein
VPDSTGMHTQAVRREPSGNCRQSCGTGGLAPSPYRCRTLRGHAGTQHNVERLRRLHNLRLSSLCHLVRYGFIVARWSPPSLTYPRRGPPCPYFFKQRRNRGRGGTSLVISEPVGSRPAAINCRAGRETPAFGLRCNRDRSCGKNNVHWLVRPRSGTPQSNQPNRFPV